MDFLKYLWPNSASNVITIPQHIEGELEDDLDLKVRALAYLFKRMDVENLPSFVNDGNGMYKFGCSSDAVKSSMGNEKLDAIYNKTEFERVLVSDEHRILIDWFKNRFRSICILSDTPHSSFEAQLAKNFKFIILKASSSDEVYINTLVESDLYVEHSIDLSTKRQIVTEAIKSQHQLRPSSKKTFNKNDRSLIILKYIQRLSELVQIERIYKASLITKLESFKSSRLGQIRETIDEFNENEVESEEENGVRLFPSNAVRSSTSRSRSPVRRYSTEPSKQPLSPIKLNSFPQLQPASPASSFSNNGMKLTPSSSPTRSSASSPVRAFRSRSSSPVKPLKKKQSMTLLKMDKSLSQVDNDIPLDEEEWITKEEMATIQSQSEQAVLFRVERERKVLRSN